MRRKEDAAGGKFQPDVIPYETVRAKLMEAKGQVYIAARLLKCSPSTVYRRLENYPELRELCDNFQGEFVDTAVLQLHIAVGRGEGWAIRYTLDSQGKDRGYGQTRPDEGSDDRPDAPGKVLTDDELDQRIGDLDKRIASAKAGAPPAGGRAPAPPGGS